MTPKERIYQAVYHAEQYAHRRRLGICVGCGKVDAAPNKTKCPACLLRDRAYRRKYYKHRPEYFKTRYNLLKKRGLCPRCDKNPKADNAIHCESCRAQMAIYNKKRS